MKACSECINVQGCDSHDSSTCGSYCTRYREATPATQSAREVAHLIRMEEPSGHYDTVGYEQHMAARIEAYAESRVQEAIEKMEQETWKWFCDTGREDNFPARYNRRSDSIDIAMREPKP